MKLILFINLVCFLWSVYWTWESGFESEPIIVSLSLLSTLIGMSIKLAKTKRIKIKGNRNYARQSEAGSDGEIEGDGNTIIQ
jgi:flagellar biosynthesis component FlhA